MIEQVILFPQIRTKRLLLIALSTDRLRLLLKDTRGLEQDISVAVARGLVPGPTRRAIRAKLAKMSRAVEAQRVWYTYWLLVVKEENAAVGMIGFKGEPTTAGAVEIGYGIVSSHRSKGYMTEAARALIDWAFQSGRCTEVVAETLKTNRPSASVLSKLGLTVTGETERHLYWRLKRLSATGASSDERG